MSTRLRIHLRANPGLLLVSVVIMLISLTAYVPTPGIPTQVHEVPRVDKKEVLQKQEKGANPLVADTGSESEYNEGRIKEAVSAPLQVIERGEWQRPAGKEIVLYCS